MSDADARNAYRDAIDAAYHAAERAYRDAYLVALDAYCDAHAADRVNVWKRTANSPKVSL